MHAFATMLQMHAILIYVFGLVQLNLTAAITTASESSNSVVFTTSKLVVVPTAVVDEK